MYTYYKLNNTMNKGIAELRIKQNYTADEPTNVIHIHP